MVQVLARPRLRRTPQQARARRRIARVATTTVATADALLRQAFRSDPDGDPRVLDEAKLLLRGYLAQRLDIHPET